MDAHLQISTDESHIDPVCGFVYSWGLNCGLSVKEARKFTVAVSELITDIILFAFPDNDTAHFDMTFKHSDINLELIVTEAGEPFDPDLHKYDANAAREEGNFEGAGFRLLREFCDEFLFINRGKEGKEFRLTKKRENDYSHPIDRLLNIPTLKQRDFTKSNQKTTQALAEYSISQIIPSDAEDISKLIYRTYQYTYSKEDMYFPKRIEQAVTSKERLGVIARSSEGEAIGYFAVLKMEDTNLAEVGEAVVSPNYRRQGIMGKMMHHLVEIANRQKLTGIFGKAVTIHSVSQKVNAKYGFKSTALILANTSNVVYKGFDEEYPQPVSVIFDYLPLIKRNNISACLPPKYKNILRETYRELGITITEEKLTPYTLKGQSDVSLDIDYISSTAGLSVLKYGEDFDTEISEMIESIERWEMNAIYIDFPLDDPATLDKLEQISNRGFFYSGLLPQFHNNRDFLRLQKIYVPLDLSLIKVYSSFGNQIKSVIDEEYHKHATI